MRRMKQRRVSVLTGLLGSLLDRLHGGQHDRSTMTMLNDLASVGATISGALWPAVQMG
jgi:hypothetical protein